MTTIKFRAWDKKLSKWIEGAYGFHILGENMLIGGLFQNYLTPDISKLNDISIMQFTGLYDKNGTEIYEGDLFRVADNRKYEIRYSTGFENHGEWSGALFALHLKDWTEIPFDAWTMEHGEVIGNIYESPALLAGLKKEEEK